MPKGGWDSEDDDTVVLPAAARRPGGGRRWSYPRQEPDRPGPPSGGSGPHDVSVEARQEFKPRTGRHRRVRENQGDQLRGVLGVTGEVLITMGVVVLLFVVYEVYVTDWLSAGKQQDATTALDDQWNGTDAGVINSRNDRTEKFRPSDGEGFAKLYVPAFGSDFVFTVLEGTTDRTLEAGPGHYEDSAFPGEPGNFAIAGHRVGKGAPFNDLDLLRSCDALVVETQHNWFVYRVLPMRGETANWETGRGAERHCAQVKPLGGPYAGVVGQEIVLPSQKEVIAPVPDRPELYLDAVPPEERAALITLTTCHPRFSAAKRLVLHGVFVKQYPKDPANPAMRPPELTEA